MGGPKNNGTIGIDYGLSENRMEYGTYLRWQTLDKGLSDRSLYPQSSITAINSSKIISGQYSFNDKDIYTTDGAFSTSNTNVYIFNDNSLLHPAKVKVYSLQLYDENENLIRDFVPAYRKKGDDIPFRQDELDAGLAILKSIYYTNSASDFQTYALEYN